MPLQYMNKVTLKIEDKEHLSLIFQGLSLYGVFLENLSEKEPTAQRMIHLSILNVLNHEIKKKIISRSVSKSTQLKLEVFMAFVFIDALHYYGEDFNPNPYNTAICSKYIMQLEPELPSVTDFSRYSFTSKLINA